MTLGGTWTQLMLQLASIITLLASVSKLIENGYRVVFDGNDSYILNKNKKEYQQDEKGKRSMCR